MPGPLPDPNAIRRNAPTIPTVTLPLSGREGSAPDVPSWVTLSDDGMAWWGWAWSTPQACAWGTSVGMESAVAHRASLEDDLGRAAETRERLPILKAMNDLDNQLGLTPKGMAALRWKIVDDTPAEASAAHPVGGNVTGIDSRRSRLTDAS